MVTWVCPNTCTQDLIEAKLQFSIYTCEKYALQKSSFLLKSLSHLFIWCSPLKYHHHKIWLWKRQLSAVPSLKHRITGSTSQLSSQCTQLKFIVLSTSTFCLLEDRNCNVKVTFRSLKGASAFSLQLIKHCRQPGGILL